MLVYSTCLSKDKIMYSYILVQVQVHVYAEYCHKRVEKMTMMGAKKGLKKPSLDEIQHAKVSIILYRCSHHRGASLRMHAWRYGGGSTA